MSTPQYLASDPTDIRLEHSLSLSRKRTVICSTVRSEIPGLLLESTLHQSYVERTYLINQAGIYASCPVWDRALQIIPGENAVYVWPYLARDVGFCKRLHPRPRTTATPSLKPEASLPPILYNMSTDDKPERQLLADINAQIVRARRAQVRTSAVVAQVSACTQCWVNRNYERDIAAKGYHQASH